MNQKKLVGHLLVLAALVFFNISLIAQEAQKKQQDKQAQKKEKDKQEESKQEEQKKFSIVDELTGGISFGGLGTSREKNASRYLEYRDLDNFQVYQVWLRKKRKIDDNFYFNLKAEDIGEDDQHVEMEYSEWGEMGDYKFTFVWDRLPHRYGTTGQTLYSGIGGSYLRLSELMRTDIQAPNSGSVTEAANKLRSYANDGSNYLDDEDDVMVLRDKLTFGLEWFTWDPLRMAISVEYEERDGVRPVGASFGLPSAVEIFEPIDYTDLNLNYSISYAKDELDLGLYYTFSIFNSHKESLTYDNPYRATDFQAPFGQPAFVGRSYDAGTAAGQMGLEADNMSHHIAFKSGYNLSKATRLKGEMHWSWIESETSLLPYSVNTALRNPVPPFDATDPGNLPDRNFDGKSYIQYYQLSLDSRIAPEFDAHFFTRYNDFNDKKERLTFPGYAKADMTWEATAYSPNRYDYSKWTSGVDMHYRMRSLKTRFHADYKFEHMHRQHRNVKNNRENSITVGADTNWSQSVKTRVDYGMAWRRYKDYDQTVTVFEVLDQFRMVDQAERNRMHGSAELAFSPVIADGPVESFDIIARYRFLRDDYQVRYGLQEYIWQNIALDTNVKVNASYALGIFFSYDRGYTDQKNRQRDVVGPTNTILDYANSDWDAKITENVYTIGIRPTIHLVRDKLILTGSYSYTWNNSHIDLSSPTGTLGVDDVNEDPIDIRNAENSDRHTLNLELTYNLNPNAKIFAGYEVDLFNYGNYYYNDYVQITTPVGPGDRGAYLSGVRHQDHKIHIGYAGVSLSF